jgi:hypothetical protein
MNTDETLDTNQFGDGVLLNEKIKGFLLETAKWAKFLSIIGFIGIGLMVIGAIVIIIFGASMGFRGGQPILMGLIYLGMTALYFFPVYYLFNFATNIKKGINSNTQEGITFGFENLKSHYKFLGIMTIIVLSIYGFMFLILLLTQLGR